MKSLLGLLDKEETDCLRDGVSDISHSNLVVSVNPCSNFLDKQVSTLIVRNVSVNVLWLLDLALIIQLLTSIVLVLRLLLLLRDNVCARGEVVGVIGEQVILFSINEGLDNDSCLFSLFLEHVHDDVHDFGDHRGETLEDLVHNALAHLLEHVVHVLQQIESWLSKFLELRLDQVNKYIDRWEAWDGISLVKHDCLLNISISVLTSRIVVSELFVQVIEMKLDLGTT